MIVYTIMWLFKAGGVKSDTPRLKTTAPQTSNMYQTSLNYLNSPEAMNVLLLLSKMYVKLAMS